MGRHAVDSNMVFFEDMEIPVEDRIGEEGEGFRALLHGLNPERVLIAAEAIGIGRVALARATRYARERVVFGRPIGQNQSIQHPLAECWAELEAANLMMLKAAWLYDTGQECGAEANAAKYLAAEAGFRACEHAVMTHGGMGYAQEYPRRALFARSADHPHRPGQPAAHPQLPGRARAGSAEILLSRGSTGASSGSTRSSATTSAFTSTLPACSKFTVTRAPIADCTCPNPQSGCPGWRTHWPGSINVRIISPGLHASAGVHLWTVHP